MASKYLLLGMLYFVQGMPYGLQSGLLPIYLRTVGLSFTSISLTKALYFPWILKVFWAPFVDQCWNKQTWLLLSMCGLAVACLTCASLSPGENCKALATVLILMNLMASTQDIAVDGMAVRLLNQDEVGYGNTIQVVGYKLGSVLAGGGFLAVIHLIGWRSLFLLLASMYCLVMVYTWHATELQTRPSCRSDREKLQHRSLNPCDLLQELLIVPGTTWTLIFVINYKLGEQGAMSMFPLFLLDNGFSPQELGVWNGMVAMGFSIAGSTLGGVLISRKGPPLSLLKVSLILRLASLCFQALVLFLFSSKSSIIKVAAIFSIILQHFMAGIISTLTFSIMMHCTQRAVESIQQFRCPRTARVSGMSVKKRKRRCPEEHYTCPYCSLAS
ncbi:major facilitator superfamily domain-containing protein 3 isoform X2 [Ambystoma mexicanum]|uniref:major facilitator superfamily domain-containing protein 3 isoform X2 n=1 Tax=Ambystoma mexicanum TaxID=8296 RepID=UPI0037E8C94D